MVCKDENCPFHGSLKLTKRSLTGVVDSAKMRRTVNVKRELRVLLKKYERFAKRYSSIKAHNPDCIGAKEGEIVTITACRPLSKSKHFVVVSKKQDKTEEA
ncbi:30S ribosomal protein S17 [Candidatus Woesearchaeota archaeon]|nr:30S ribosomal protein S17 [Candidatus Woesearchaeota archaeon]|tara:strand:+ start:14334 stop:14636 length:303 start_codon:yes stop_codon:yes gene_type:complete